MSNQSDTYSYIPYQAVDGDSINLRAIILRYLRNWYWFLISIAILTVAAYVYLRYQPPVYKSQASLLIKDEKKGIDQDDVLKELVALAPKKVVENEIEILKSYTLMERVVEQLHLDVVYFQDTPYGKREIYEKSPIRLIVERASPALYEDAVAIRFKNAQTVFIGEQAYPTNTSIQTPYGRLRIFTRKAVNEKTDPVYVKLINQTQVVTKLSKLLKAEPISKASTVILLTVETSVSDKGEAILDRLVDVYNQAAITDKNQVAANTLKFIDERLSLISGELASVEKGVELYKSAQGITDLSAQAQTFLETVQQNDAQLNQVNIQLGALQDLEHYISQQPSNRGGTPATVGLSDPTLLSLIDNINKLEARREDLIRTTSERNPVLETIDSQIRTNKASIAENVATMKAMLKTKTWIRLISRCFIVH